ncbi:MAG: BspA family leucine-rich repeat surface protein [Clostridiales bacterium]|nr:BspA family leucine-rich repeat surface protein [Clostridiales bacterium]
MNTKTISTILTLALTLALCQTSAPTEAATPQLSTKKLTIKVGKTATLKVKKTSKNTKKRAKWTVASGKKVIRLSEKKKASVKVKALKTGKANISCKIGAKKLTCKVVVKGNVKPEKTTNPTVTPTNIPTNATNVPTLSPTQSPTVTASATPVATATVTPSSMPTSTPTQTPEYVIKCKNTPGPTADYDCLQVEPVEYKSYIDLEQGAFGVLWCEEMKFFGTDIWRNEIEQIRISDSKEVPTSVLGQYDLSEKKNGSVMAWYTDVDNDGKYEVTIGQDGGVVANENSSYLFSDIINKEEHEPFLVGIENLDTSHVVDMHYMFYFSHDNTAVLDLGDNFDTSNVKNISHMFRDMAYPKLDKVRLGKKFDTSAVEMQTWAFRYIEAGDNTLCYVKDEVTRDWFIQHTEDMCWHVGIYSDWTYKPEYDNLVIAEN